MTPALPSHTLTGVLALCLASLLATSCAGPATNSASPRAVVSRGSPAVAASAAASVTEARTTPTAQLTPSLSAQMPCQAEIRDDVTAVLALHNPPPPTSTWADNVFTCTYPLAGGSLVISVQQSPDDTAAGQYFQAQRQQQGLSHQLFGLGTAAFSTPTGSVLVLKDNMTLDVDTTALPTPVGTDLVAARIAVASELATDVMGCWTGS